MNTVHSDKTFSSIISPITAPSLACQGELLDLQICVGNQVNQSDSQAICLSINQY
jgi:hypothetical protein